MPTTMNIHKTRIVASAFADAFQDYTLEEMVNLSLVNKDWHMFLSPTIKQELARVLAEKVPMVLTFGNDASFGKERYDFKCTHISHGHLLKLVGVIDAIKQRKACARFPPELRFALSTSILDLPEEVHENSHYHFIATMNFILLLPSRYMSFDNNKNDYVIRMVLFNILLMYILTSRNHNHRIMSHKIMQDTISTKIEDARQGLKQYKVPDVLHYHLHKNCEAVEEMMKSMGVPRGSKGIAPRPHSYNTRLMKAMSRR
jgi:hypothetical protein